VLTAKIIDPATRKNKLTCSSCGISYSAREYQLLYDSKKIIYFKFKNKVICHECLVKKIREHSAGEKIKIVIYSDEHKFKCEFDPNSSSDSDISFDNFF
tara:strand:- start:1814 stop:2110 length:297 start_codon:yes stop_codon:yes gene_type:complete